MDPDEALKTMGNSSIERVFYPSPGQILTEERLPSIDPGVAATLHEPWVDAVFSGEHENHAECIWS